MFNSNRILIIDYLRVIAVLLVLLFHFFPKYFFFGYIGVDIFLVISGFVISKSIENLKGNHKWFIFFKKRFFRLFPNLFFILSITYLIFVFLYPDNLISVLNGGLISSLSIVSNLYYGTVSGYFDIVSEINPFLHSWSLSLEWQFYIIITFLIAFFSTKTKIRNSVVIITLLSLVLMVYYSPIRPVFNFYSFTTRFFEFGIGFIAYHFKNDIKYNLRYILLILFLSIFLFDGFDNSNWPNLFSFSLVIIISLVILNDKNLQISNPYFKKIILWVSDRSYSIYLVHFPFAAYFKFVNIKPIDSWSTVLVFVIIFVFSDFTFRFVENKFRFNYNNKYSNVSVLIIPVFLFFLYFNKNNVVYDDEYGNYVKNKFEILNYNENNLDKEIFVIGDSFAQDFVNLLSDGFLINNDRIITKYIDMNCGNVYIDSKDLLKNFPIELKGQCSSFSVYSEFLKNIDDNDILVISSNWPAWTLDYIQKSIDNIRIKFKGTVILVGTKHIGKQSPFHINNLPKDIKINLKSNPPLYVNKTNENLRKSVDSLDGVIFFDIQKFMLDENLSGIVCDSFGNIISYDGGHLTKPGVKFISNRIPNNFKNLFYVSK